MASGRAAGGDNRPIVARHQYFINKTEDELSKEMRLYAAIRFYQSGKLTIGKAAEFAELSRFEFENVLADSNIPISKLGIEDIQADFEKIRNI